jgi:tryptophan synthase alpha chain
MSRLEGVFKQLKENNKKALVPFITAGHPHPLLTVPAMHSLVKNGASIIELGMPFSDPMADGTVIQEASEKAIKDGMTLGSVLGIVSEFRESDKITPIVLMGYLNPIEKFGYEPFVKQAAQSGIDGLLIVDCPPEESEKLVVMLKNYSINQIFLIAPTTDKKRQMFILSQSSGFVYCVALKGVTGAQQSDFTGLAEKIKTIRAISDIPVAIGFGVKDIDSAVSVSKYGDAVVIGSALVSRLDKCKDQKEIEETIEEYIKPIADAINKV